MSTYQTPAEADDCAAIVALTIHYCWSIDTKDYAALHDVFLPDATANLVDERVGIDSIIARIDGALTSLDISQHMVSNHQVVLNGDEATCRCYLQAQHVRRDAEGGPNYIVAGRYQDQLVRTDAGWRIRRRELFVDWTEGNVRVVHPGR
jgi:hypothetical protein